MTRKRYAGHTSRLETATFEEIRTNWESVYTPLIIDLADSYNQGATNTNRPFDRVSGYTISEMERWLGRCGDIQDLRHQLGDKFNKPDNVHLDELFDQYVNLSR